MAELRVGAGSDEVVSSYISPDVSYIIPGVLYPAVAGKLLDGSTSHSGAFGTAQADGFSYYYTDIKGSKPIKDPRIGAHFGSHRHKIKSLQLLEQETATHGANVYSIDGREWMRAAGNNLLVSNNNRGNCVTMSKTTTDTNFIEVVGYWNNINLDRYTDTDNRYLRVSLNGGTVQETDFNPGVSSPLYGRFVDSGSILKISFNSTPVLGINTIKILNKTADEYNIHSIELISQDTTSTATKSQIQIPSQNVVSYGKKFAVAAATPHYNPFAFAGDGTTAVAIGNTTSHGKVADGWTGSTATYFDSTLDTATSLGLSAWETGGDFYRPVNGGRIVKWVDSTGVIKTSVNMMPPCGTSVVAGSDASLPTSHAWTTVYQPKIKSGSIDHSLAEVAKTFHWREFGNGAANQGSGGTLADASMLTGTHDNIFYVMDDGLTSFSSVDAFMCGTGDLCHDDTLAEMNWFTFIGTGVGWISTTASGNAKNITVAQNLPYGTHILKMNRSGVNELFAIDGVAISGTAFGTYGSTSELVVHQPKRPPIPEDAVVIADYMLMADFVPQTADGQVYISKGVRLNDVSRDVFSTISGGETLTLSTNVGASGHRLQSSGASSGSSVTFRLLSFGTNIVQKGENMADPGRSLIHIDTTSQTVTKTAGTDTHQESFQHITTSKTLGLYNWGTNPIAARDGVTSSYQIATPIHTSSHYQTFETPFLYELVGGDRNMEQTNLVVTADGKTWDEVTRDTSYIGIRVLQAGYDTNLSSTDTPIGFDDWRGNSSTHPADQHYPFFNKDFAIGYDKQICLRTGTYAIHTYTQEEGSGGGRHASIDINGTAMVNGSTGDNGDSKTYVTFHTLLKRGDYVRILSQWAGSHMKSGYWIERI